MNHEKELFVLIAAFNPEYHDGGDNIVGVFNSVSDAELFLPEYTKDFGLDPKDFSIVSTYLKNLKPRA